MEKHPEHSKGNQTPSRPGYIKEQLTPEQAEAEVNRLLALLKDRFGNRLPDELEGTLLRREITYDDYIETPTLLSLQGTLTDFHDELIFKVYHQQTELWFRLVLHEIQKGIRCLISETPDLTRAIEAASRINRYFDLLTSSFSVLIDGLSSAEFLEFRKAFGTSSGFQSSQFRAIEILAGLEREKKPTASKESRSIQEQSHTQKSAEEQAAFYWEKAARHLTTNEPTLTLVKFKEKHIDYLNSLYESRKPFSLRMAYRMVVSDALNVPMDDEEVFVKLFERREQYPLLIELAQELLKFDDSVVLWKQSHLRSAAKHLARAPRGTGETNWAEYLAKSIAEQRCFPELLNASKQVSQPETITN